MRYGNVVVAHHTRPTLARQAHVRVPGVRLLGRGHCPVRRRLSPPQARVKSRGAHGTRPTNRLVSPRGEKRGVGLGRKANQKFWGDDRRFCGGCCLADLRHGHGNRDAESSAHGPAICTARRASCGASWRAAQFSPVTVRARSIGPSRRRSQRGVSEWQARAGWSHSQPHLVHPPRLRPSKTTDIMTAARFGRGPYMTASIAECSGVGESRPRYPDNHFHSFE